VRLVWRFHAVHHSLPRLYWLNAGYFHPVDAVLNYALEVIPLILLGAPRQLLALYAVLTAVNGMLKHSNIDLRTGALSWIFSTPELHRWHHSPDPAEGNTNYGSNLVVWDVVFRTRHLPPRRPPAEIRGARVPDGYLGQLAYPLGGE
jgi:sterol desaturase/sphingolipid hydroxylase (fatty acid hydroxylase superfamily)